MRILGFICGAVLTVLMATAAIGGQLTVTGQGHVESVPDMATVRLGVTGQAKTAADALRENSAATRDVLDRVMAAGVEARDVQTSGLNLSPIWNNRQSSNGEQPDIVGYMVTNQVTVRVRDISLVGQVLDDVVQNGANTFNGLEFGLQDPGPATDEARKRAVAEALRKARIYADAAGVTLGAITEINEAGDYAPQPMLRREMAMSDAVPIAEGEVSVGSTVTVIFEIE